MGSTIILGRAGQTLCPICKKDLTTGEVDTNIEEYNGVKVFICASHIVEE